MEVQTGGERNAKEFKLATGGELVLLGRLSSAEVRCRRLTAFVAPASETSILIKH
jgi:hypothetical protein